MRSATFNRQTKETSVKVELFLDGSGSSHISTGLRMFDHLLEQLAKHGLFDLVISAQGVDSHHLVEDVAIGIGRALSMALADKKGITRMGYAVVPMDDALAMVAVDIGGRGYAAVELPFTSEHIADLPTDMVTHFLQTLAVEARINLHARLLEGINDHHKVEALFKALARALDNATRIDERRSNLIPSTKGIIES